MGTVLQFLTSALAVVTGHAALIASVMAIVNVVGHFVPAVGKYLPRALQFCQTWGPDVVKGLKLCAEIVTAVLDATRSVGKSGPPAAAVLVLAGATLLATNGCGSLGTVERTGCTVIDLANTACKEFVFPDGSRVKMSPEDTRDAVKMQAALKAGGSVGCK